MAGISAALAITNEGEACWRFCNELRAARHGGPAELKVLQQQLPFLMQRLYLWFGLSNPGTEEALLRTFHPDGPLWAHLAALHVPSFIFPLRRLPPRALRAAVLSIADGGWGPTWIVRERLRASGYADLGSAWFSLLGPGRLARAQGGEAEGVVLTSQEFMLTCLIYFLLSEPLPTIGSSQGASSSGGGGGLAGTAQPAWNASGSSSLSGGSSSSTSRSKSFGALSPTFERILLAHLQAHLQHSQYELAYSQQSTAARFLLHLLHEFLLAPRPPEEAEHALRAQIIAGGLDSRAQPGPLHATRLVALHILANPALRQGCEETYGGMAHARGGRLTREVALFGPALIELVAELLLQLLGQKQAGLDVLTSLTRLWLVILQPWKAKRLYEWYLTVRSSQPRLEPPDPAATRTAPNARQIDVALLGLEPECPPGAEAPVPLIPASLRAVLNPDSSGSGLAAAVGFGSGTQADSVTAAGPVLLLPGEGDAKSWRSYVVSFQGAYCLLEAFLRSPLHVSLCLQLCRHVAAGSSDGRGGAAASSAVPNLQPATGFVSGAGAWGHAAPPKASALLGEKQVVAALKALAQALLCFTDPLLLKVLADLPPDAGPGRWVFPAAPLFVAGDQRPVLRPQTALALSSTWATLLAAANHEKLRPLLAAVSQQLQQATPWLGRRLPALEEIQQHKAFATEVLQDLRQHSESFTDASPAPQRPPPPEGLVAASPLSEAQFLGSEWQRPVRGGEMELLVFAMYWLAHFIDWALGRDPIPIRCGQDQVPQTEWPRLFANWKFSAAVLSILLVAVQW